MTDEERRAFAAKYGLRPQDVPTGDEVDDAARRLVERIRDFASRYGVRADCIPDAPIFRESEE